MDETRYRLSVDVTGPSPWPAGGLVRVRLPSGGEAWVEAAPLTQYLTAVDPLPVPEYGAWFAGNETAEDYRIAAGAGLRWARIRWFSTGTDWRSQVGWAEAAVANARGAGLRVLLEYWAWAAPVTKRCDLPTVSMASWTDLSSYLAIRLGDAVAAIQPGNEPDIADAALCPMWPAYVSAASRAWRQTGWAGTVVAPGMAMMTYANARRSEWEKLRGIAGDVNVLAIHCYAEDLRRSWPGGIGLPGQIAALRASAGGWAGPVWLTETGGIAGPRVMYHPWRSEAQQAVETQGVVTDTRAAGVPVTCFYSWRDQAGQSEQHGLCRVDGTPRPAVARLKEVL